MIKPEKSPSPWLVNFPRKFGSRGEFFAVIKRIAKIGVVPMKIVGFPFREDAEKNQSDLILRCEDMTIRVKNGATPLSLLQRSRSFGFDYPGDSDWWITFDKFPHLEPVRLYKARGAPRKNYKRVQVLSTHEELKSWKKTTKQLGLNSIEAARYYQSRAEPRRTKKDSLGTKESTAESKSSKTSGN